MSFRAILFFCFFLVSVSAASLLTERHVGQYKGKKQISKEISVRFFQHADAFDVNEYLNNETGLGDLLGAYIQEEGVSRYKNGKPNGINVVLYHVIFSKLSRNLASVCTGDSPIEEALKESFKKALQELCAWPEKSVRNEKALKNFWLLTMGYEAPQSEFEAWKSFILENYSKRSAKDSIEAMTLSIFMNPYFLLES